MPPPEKSFIQKYWMYIAVAAVALRKGRPLDLLHPQLTSRAVISPGGEEEKEGGSGGGGGRQ